MFVASPSRCLLLVVFAGMCLESQVEAATRVELVLDEPRQNRTVSWPVTTGVPFPQGALTSAEQCRLIDDQGREQPLQTKVAATWDAARTSIRWLTIDFIAQPGRTYALEFGPDVARQSFSAAITIAQTGDVVVRTGPLEVEFSRRGPAALGAVRIDRNGDGRIEPAERIASGPADGDHQFLDENQTRWSGALDRADRQIVVESSGPVRACVRVDGWYTAPDGRRIVAYRTRYHLFASLPVVKIIDEFRIAGSTRELLFRDIALPLDLHLEKAQRRVTAALGDVPDAKLYESAAPADRAVSVVQQTYRHYGNDECRGYVQERDVEGERNPREAPRVGPWVQVADEHVAITGSLRWFWQQFPKQWEINQDRLTLHLWSPQAGVLDFGEAGLRKFFGPAGEKYLLDWQGTRTPQTPIENFFYFAGRHALARDGADGLGINKHHELWYHFARADQAPAGREYGARADRPPLCLAAGKWNVGTGVFGPLAARPNDSSYEKIVDRVFELERYAQDAFGDYGWFLFGAGPHYSYQWDAEAQRHYADPRRFEYHTYQRETQLWWNYLRSGERKFYDWAIPSENHWVDVAVSHAPMEYSTQWRGGVPGEASLHYRPGDWSIDSPLHYVRHHDTGEAWLRSAPQFWATYHRTLETTTLAYYLTGDERFNDVIEFWRDYWRPLAGVKSDAAEVLPWHREQLWWRPTAAGEPTKTWAEMLRDYAPFQSGSRHQMTLLFNLSTLYEHTWDEQLGQVTREFADAYLAPDQPNGVWQCQDHRLPASADSPMLAHFWSPALWKYARATGDPRMPEVLRKYFTASIEADPYGEDVGIYSNVQIAWAWHFTKDPRHLAAARQELDSLLPNAEPLARPEDLNRRIYNPFAPIKTLAAVPRLIGILEEAARTGVALPPPAPLEPQSALIAIRRRPGQPACGVLWGWDPQPQMIDDQGQPCGAIAKTTIHRSHRQPQDRVLPGYRVYRHEFSLPASGDSPWAFLAPQVETGILKLSAAGEIWCWAGEPVQIQQGQTWHWRKPMGTSELVLESAQAAQLRAAHQGQPVAIKLVKNRATVSLADLPADAVLAISAAGERSLWFRMPEQAADACWVAPSVPRSGLAPPAPPASLVAARRPAEVDVTQTFVPGRFGQGLLIVPGRELHIPDEAVDAQGVRRRLSEQAQGTIEFWIRRLWDERLTPGSMPTVLSAGSVFAPLPLYLPRYEWTHVAVVWHPIPQDAGQRSLVHVYVDGVDYGNYRSIYWQGYSQPPTFSPAREWLKQFVVRCSPALPFVIDDLRISTRPRYIDLSLGFGRDQTFNPHAFEPPTKPAEDDQATALWLPLDGDLRGSAAGKIPVEATLIREKR